VKYFGAFLALHVFGVNEQASRGGHVTRVLRWLRSDGNRRRSDTTTLARHRRSDWTSVASGII